MYQDPLLKFLIKLGRSSLCSCISTATSDVSAYAGQITTACSTATFDVSEYSGTDDAMSDQIYSVCLNSHC